MTDLSINMVHSYFDNISKLHKNLENKSGFEKNDRSIFIRDLLGGLGYNLENILDDVSQRIDNENRSPDIRLFGNDEVKSKQSHSQFIIETKNFNLLNKDINNVDFLQLKRYIKANQSKVRLIASTDYVTLFLFNATKIKKDPVIKLNNLTSITSYEIDVFKKNILTTLHYDDFTQKSKRQLELLSYDKIFKEQKFINPSEYEETNSILDPSVRKNFILTLYNLMIKFEDDIKYEFFDRVDYVLDSLEISSQYSFSKLNELLNDPRNLVVRAYFLWGSEMNYISNFLTNPQISDRQEIINYLKLSEHREAFVLTSIYNLINKTFFLRILEDIATHNTRFIKDGAENYRYLSNGILSTKLKESEESLIEYLKNVYEFQKNDLKRYSFLLKKDIYSWVLDYISPHNLLALIRLFNDTYFKKLNQDILGDIYEHYLEQGSDENQEKTFRRLLGQYYTPKPIVRLIWTLVRNVMVTTNYRDIYEKDLPLLSILDPACGSGTFLSEAILQINSIANKTTINKSSVVFGFINDRNEYKKIEEHINGFELNPLSKTIADINVFFGLTQAYGADNIDKFPINNLNILRTDSLDLNALFEKRDTSEDINLFMYSEDVQSSIRNHNAVNKAKTNKYDVIVGNPPYGHIQPSKFMKEELIPYAYAENNYNKLGEEVSFLSENSKFQGTVPDNEKNRGKLNDMYAFFFGIADIMVKEKGIIAFITSNTYLTIPTYKWMRKYWLENYEISYIINFNNISEKSNSMFSPEAGIATSIMIMSKVVPSTKHNIKYLDLSDIQSIYDKYNVFCNILWDEQKKDKNDIKNFTMKNLKDIPFKEMNQLDFLSKNDYVLSYSEYDVILDVIEKQSVAITHYTPKNSGVDVGDLKYLVDPSKEGLKHKIVNYVFRGKLDKFNKTSRDNIKNNLENNKIKKVFNDELVYPFVYQKDIEQYGYSKTFYTYMDNNILWRSRINNNKNINDNEILSNVKLCIKEKRSVGEISACVISGNVMPQHGGRFMYLVPSESISEDDLYLMAALINSNIVQLFYRFRQLGDKDVLIKKLELIPLNYKTQLIKLSKKAHQLVSDRMKFENNNLDFTSDWFNINIRPNIEIYNLTEDNIYWELISIGNELFQDYSINNPELDPNNSSIIILNPDLKIKFNEPKLAQHVLKNYLKNYSGDITKDKVEVNITEFMNIFNYQHIVDKIYKEIEILTEEINSIVYKIYELEDRANLITSSLAGSID